MVRKVFLCVFLPHTKQICPILQLKAIYKFGVKMLPFRWASSFRIDNAAMPSSIALPSFTLIRTQIIYPKYTFRYIILHRRNCFGHACISDENQTEFALKACVLIAYSFPLFLKRVQQFVVFLFLLFLFPFFSRFCIIFSHYKYIYIYINVNQVLRVNKILYLISCVCIDRSHLLLSRSITYNYTPGTAPPCPALPRSKILEIIFSKNISSSVDL